VKIDLTVLLNTEVKTACFVIMVSQKPESPLYVESLDLRKDFHVEVYRCTHWKYA